MKLQSSKGWTARRIIRLTLVIAAMSQAVAGYAQTYYVVSGCKPGTFDYTSAHQPRTGTPPGATIYICQETYNEQVTIQRPLNFQDIQIGDGDSVILAYPEGTFNTVSRYFGEFAAQVALLWRLTFTLFSAISA